MIKFNILAALLFLISSASLLGKKNDPTPSTPGETESKTLGVIRDKAIRECSGIAASRRFPGIFWIHNDGPRPVLYAIRANGDVVARFALNVAVSDWEDLALDGAGHLYLADIGNNDRQRQGAAIFQFNEPDPHQPSNQPLNPKQFWNLRYPKKPFDCESLFIWEDRGYLISKETGDKTADLYRFALTKTSVPVPLEKVAELPIKSPVSAADLRADGRDLAVLSKSGVFLFRVTGKPGLIAGLTPQFYPFRHEKNEGCAFTANGLMITAESREIFLLTHPAFRTTP